MSDCVWESATPLRDTPKAAISVGISVSFNELSDTPKAVDSVGISISEATLVVPNEAESDCVCESKNTGDMPKAAASDWVWVSFNELSDTPKAAWSLCVEKSDKILPTENNKDSGKVEVKSASTLPTLNFLSSDCIE